MASPERPLENLLNRINDGIVGLDINACFTYANPQATAMLQRQWPEELQGKNIWQEFPEIVDLPFGKALLQAMETQAPTFVESLYPSWDTWFENRIYPSPNGVSIVFTDITDRKKHEETLRQSESALREAQQLAHIGHWEMRLDTMELLWSDEVYRIFEVNPDRIKPTLRLLLESTHPEEKSGFLRFTENFRQDEKNVSFVNRIVMKDGRIKHIAILGRTRPSAQGEHVLATGTLQDITEQKTHQEKQGRLSHEMENARRLEALSQLARSISHDMNNILTAILGAASATCAEFSQDSQACRNAQTIVRACDRGRHIMRGLMEFTRTETLMKDCLDLNQLLEEVLQGSILDQRIKLVMDLDKSLPAMEGDRASLFQAIRHLVSNALFEMQSGGTLSIATRHESGQILLSVEDTGQGMTPDVLERAIDPFFTTKSSGTAYGLGLPYVYRIVKSHHGSMAIRSEPGLGTSVFLHFPSNRKKVADPGPNILERQLSGIAKSNTPLPEKDLQNPGEAVQPRESSLKQSAKPAHVMLVDDDELIRSSMQTILQVLGLDAIITDCGEGAIQRIKEGARPDVVILDVNMPGLGGSGTLPTLRALLPNTPVILSTGKADQNAMDLADAFPLVTLLEKPFGITELRRQLKQYIGKPES